MYSVVAGLGIGVGSTSRRRRSVAAQRRPSFPPQTDWAASMSVLRSHLPANAPRPRLVCREAGDLLRHGLPREKQRQPPRRPSRHPPLEPRTIPATGKSSFPPPSPPPRNPLTLYARKHRRSAIGSQSCCSGNRVRSGASSSKKPPSCSGLQPSVDNAPGFFLHVFTPLPSVFRLLSSRVPPLFSFFLFSL